MNKIIGYAVSGIGIFGLIVGIIPSVRTFFSISKSISSNSIILTGLIIVGLGVLILYKSGGKVSEVPIYEGKKVVGYRRV